MQKDPIKTLQQKDYHILKGCAQGYILFGRSLSEMCEHNSAVAKKLGKTNVAMLWSFVKIMYSSATSPKHQQSNELARTLSAGQSHLKGRLMNHSNSRLMASAAKSMSSGWGDEPVDGKLIADHEANDDEYLTNDLMPPKHGDFKPSGGPTGSHLTQSVRGIGPAAESTSDPLNNIVHGDSELTVEHMDYIKSFRNGFLYIGPHDLTKNFSLPSNSIMNHDMHQTQRNQIVSKERQNTSPVCVQYPSTSINSILYTNKIFIHVSYQPAEVPVSVLKILPHVVGHQWNSAGTLADCLQLLADVDDIQSAVCILIVLGDRRKDIPLDELVHVSILV